MADGEQQINDKYFLKDSEYEFLFLLVLQSELMRARRDKNEIRDWEGLHKARGSEFHRCRQHSRMNGKKLKLHTVSEIREISYY